ncbi:MAG: exodeoxyribonuclease VII large subunit [Clostridia bacterium]|nr:exodeoxyribonuclease VII large subunit [Clostridia bacterium]
MQNNRPLTVRELARYLSGRINNDPNLKQITIEGEISNFTLHQSGHIYFSLKEEDTSIRAVLFRGYRQNLDFLPANGMKVIVVGDVNIYEKTNNIQIYVQRMFQSGLGDIYLQFEQLKAKLSKEGLFDPIHKKAIPSYPSSIGVVTSPTGAALQDLRNVISRRYPLVDITVYPTTVQGESAASDIIASLKKADEGHHDTILLIRGGGSVEDLYVFNNESIARTIFSMNTPVVTGIGHEIDFTIADFVADLRAPTPSAAAEVSVPDIKDIMTYLMEAETTLSSRMQNIIDSYSEKAERYRKEFTRTLQYNLNDTENELMRRKITLDHLMEIIFMNMNNRIKSTVSRLKAANPLEIISRGYAKITDSTEHNITSIEQVDVGDGIRINISDGYLDATITDKEAINGKADI